MIHLNVPEIEPDLNGWIHWLQEKPDNNVLIRAEDGQEAVLISRQAYHNLLGLQEYIRHDLMPFDQLQREFGQALHQSGYRTREDVIQLVREVKRQMADEQSLVLKEKPEP